MFRTQVYSGPTEIISSGTIIQFNKNPIEVNVELSTFILKWIIKFVDTSSKDQGIDADISGENTLVTTFNNFKNPLGVGNDLPINIGTDGDKLIYLSYRIFSLDNSDKTLQYTIYLTQEEV